MISAIITQPNIVACPRKEKSNGFVWRVDDPLNGRVANAMLKKNDWSLKFIIDFLTEGSNSVKRQYVPILRGNVVAAMIKAIFVADDRNVMLAVIELLAEVAGGNTEFF